MAQQRPIDGPRPPAATPYDPVDWERRLEDARRARAAALAERTRTAAEESPPSTAAPAPQALQAPPRLVRAGQPIPRPRQRSALRSAAPGFVALCLVALGGALALSWNAPDRPSSVPAEIVEAAPKAQPAAPAPIAPPAPEPEAAPAPPAAEPAPTVATAPAPVAMPAPQPEAAQAAPAAEPAPTVATAPAPVAPPAPQPEAAQAAPAAEPAPTVATAPAPVAMPAPQPEAAQAAPAAEPAPTVATAPAPVAPPAPQPEAAQVAGNDDSDSASATESGVPAMVPAGVSVLVIAPSGASSAEAGRMRERVAAAGFEVLGGASRATISSAHVRRFHAEDAEAAAAVAALAGGDTPLEVRDFAHMSGRPAPGRIEILACQRGQRARADALRGASLRARPVCACSRSSGAVDPRTARSGRSFQRRQQSAGPERAGSGRRRPGDAQRGADRRIRPDVQPAGRRIRRAAIGIRSVRRHICAIPATCGQLLNLGIRETPSSC